MVSKYEYSFSLKFKKFNLQTIKRIEIQIGYKTASIFFKYQFTLKLFIDILWFGIKVGWHMKNMSSESTFILDTDWIIIIIFFGLINDLWLLP